MSKLSFLCAAGLFGSAVAVPLAAPLAAQIAGPVLPSPRGGEFEQKRALSLKASKPRDLIKDAYDPPRWLKDGVRFVRWAASGPNEGTWTIVDARARTDRAILSSADLKSQLGALLGKDAPIPTAMDYQLTPDGTRILFLLAGKPFSLALADGRVAAANPDDPALAALAGGKPSPDGSLAAFVEGGNFSLKASDRTITELKGAEYREWVLPEQPWSPDGRFLVVSRLDARNAHKIPIVDYSGPLEKLTMVAYAKTDTPVVDVQYHIIDAASGRMIPVKGLGEEGYYFQGGWRPDSSETLILVLSRDGKRLDLKAVNVSTGEARLVLREENPQTFVADLNFWSYDKQSQVTPLGDNRGFLWMSERDGWRNLYLYDYDGKLQRQVTKGRNELYGVLKVTNKDAFVLASQDGEAPYDRHVFQASLQGGPLKRLSRDPGFHQPTFSPSGDYFADSHSSPMRPRVSEVVPVGGGSPFRYSEADVSELLKIGYKPPEIFKAMAADGVTPIYGAIIKPYDFDPSKRYPVINWVYNGPYTSNLPRGYAGCGCTRGAGEPGSNGFAQMGFVLVMVEPRGSPGRGKAFHDMGYGKLGQIEIPDVVAATRQAAATRPYMDLDRVGIYGHSWGGYYALRGMVTAPDFYKAGYAGAPGALTEDAVINEPNLGLLSVNPKAYEIGSNEALAGNLKGALKIMHGTSDVNASLSTTMTMAKALISAGKHFDLLIMPGQPHGPTGSFATYYWDDRLMFFVDKLGGPR